MCCWKYAKVIKDSDVVGLKVTSPLIHRRHFLFYYWNFELD